MFTVVIASVIYAASWQTAAASTARQQFKQCLKQAESKAKGDKVAPDAFAAFARAACTAQEEAVKSALWAFDSKNKVSRKQSAADAQLQIDDLIAVAEERYTMDAAPQ